jgi:hypothetical protein
LKLVVNKFSNSLQKLESFCESEGFKGYDPFDGLNSSLFRSTPWISDSRIFKLVWIQFFKRSPLNFRPYVGIKKEYNAKAMGLFLSGYCKLYNVEPRKETMEKIDFFTEKILQSESEGYSGACWGYNFDWQARAFFQPKKTPTVVASVFVASALLDAYEITGKQNLLSAARSTCNFISADLNRTLDNTGNFAFSYSPLDKSVVFNASLLGSRLLARMYSITKETSLASDAKRSVEYCCAYQQTDGSWAYGVLPFHQWIDSFHTGYNLECISDYMKYSGDNLYTENLDKGYKYYINTFFTEDGVPKYYSNSTYPIDVHSAAQLVITIDKLGKFREQKELLEKVLEWTITNMQSPAGFFYYQKNRLFSSKIPYMRWAQAWMFYALTTYHKTLTSEQN